MPRKGCPMCREPTDPAFAPFCSRGCRDRDLLAWFGGDYRSPARPELDEDGDEGVAPSSRDDGE